MFTPTRIKLAVITGTAAVALIAAGCSSDDSSMPGMDHGSSSTTASTSAQAATRTDFDEDDVMFLQMMYPHHAQAIDMAKLAPSRTQNQELLTLAQNIEKAQGPEMAQITTLLTAFGEGAPSATTSGHGGGHGGMTGMMTDDQMKTLETLSGAEFDKQWLQMMIEHHTGAVDMANAELTDGVNPDAQAMAKAIITGQQTEIDQMKTMLRQG
ncbi:DUF305 domain-containing protein [Nocardia crassostreae]|uniref:DUF305 domain-containing protein n=1 Tax=Nocardia crassostreae TaxID=53428 RepID=UPI000834471F|nr:DUF305 domain-containing protein [Nocardia crassostreae]